MKTNILQTKKKLLTLFVMLVPLLASAQTKVKIDGIWYNIITKGNVAEVTFGGSSYDDRFNKYYGSITIPTTVTYEGIDYSVTSIGDFAFYSCSGLNAITFPEGVTSIGSHAFSGCSSLKSITLPEGVMSIEGWSFSDCSNLNAIILPESVTSIGSYAFSYCRSLTAINIPEGVMSIGYGAFSDCSRLTAINIPESVTSIDWSAFYDCSRLTAVHISSIEAWCNIYFGDDFANPLYYAKNLYLNGELIKELTIPNSVTAIKDYAFRGCSSLTSIILPNGMTSIGKEAFRGCSRLTTITIPEGVTSINYNAFTDCSSLTTIVLPKSVKYIYSEVFANCPELLDVYCYAEKVPSTEADAFDGSYPEYATLHVSTSALADYKSTSPWSSFGKFETMSIAVTGITLSQSSVSLTEGESLTLTATVMPNNADDQSISWNSSNPSVATVDNTGKVTAIAAGTATITAIANDGSGVSASCEVTVVARSYALTFLVDGDVFYTDSLTRGETITLPEVPTKEGYTFSGWSEVPETMPAEDLTISGTFTINKYLVTFKIDDEVIAADSLEYGARIVAPETPAKEGHTFSGWGEVAETVPANDVTYEGSYSVNSYLLTVTVDGKTVQADSIVYGTAITLPEAPTKEGHTFSGWSEAPETMPASDVTINGTFTINQYTITYIIDGEVFATDTINYGEAITVPEMPVKEGYDFAWSDEIPETMPAKDLVINGSYTSTDIVNIERNEEILYIYSTDGQRVNELQKGINIVLQKDGSIRKVFQK